MSDRKPPSTSLFCNNCGAIVPEKDKHYIDAERVGVDWLCQRLTLESGSERLSYLRGQIATARQAEVAVVEIEARMARLGLFGKDSSSAGEAS